MGDCEIRHQAQTVRAPALTPTAPTVAPGGILVSFLPSQLPPMVFLLGLKTNLGVNMGELGHQGGVGG